MSTERPEFQPIDTAPARRTWPWAVVGAALVATLIWFVRRAPPAPEIRPVATAAAAPAPAAELVKAGAIPAAVLPPKAEGPNVLGSAMAAAKNMAMVAKAEFDREVQRTKSAQAQAASYKKQIEELQKQLGAARAQIAAVQTAQKPPPPTDQEQILQTLAPVLRAGNGGGGQY
ncbi:MAG TPA: hypothetical protein VEP66_05495 [Myxococcales bacterium]|nr:hypothetical protein [Myxococcales bacterium]